MRKAEYLITNLKIFDSIENLSLLTFEFKFPTSFLGMVFLQEHHIAYQNLMIFDILYLTLNRIREFKCSSPMVDRKQFITIFNYESFPSISFG